MDSLDYYALASRMVGSATRRLSIPYVAHQDFEDFAQAGALEAWQASERTGRTDARYLCGAARRGIIREIVLRWSGHNPRATLPVENAEGEPLDLPVADAEPRVGLPEEVTAPLWQMLYASRKHAGGERATQAADRDLAILWLISRGFSNEGIAQELGQSPANIRRYRVEIRERLEHIAGESYAMTVP